jgi:nicotinamidase-related amidase
VLLLADHQTGVMDYVVKVPPRDKVEANVARLVRAAVHHDGPLIFTTSEEDQNGTLLPALQPIAPDAYRQRLAVDNASTAAARRAPLNRRGARRAFLRNDDGEPRQFGRGSLLSARGDERVGYRPGAA